MERAPHALRELGGSVSLGGLARKPPGPETEVRTGTEEEGAGGRGKPTRLWPRGSLLPLTRGEGAA